MGFAGLVQASKGIPWRDSGDGRLECAIGEGVNADNIVRCVALLKETGYSGVVSLECEGQGGPMLEQSLEWFRRVL